MRVSRWSFLRHGVAALAVRVSCGLAQAQTFTTLASLNLRGPDGWGPNALAQGADGDLYGTMGMGGDYNSGTIFKTTTEGNIALLYSFCSQPVCPQQPSAGLGADGNFFGTTSFGGVGGGWPFASGAIFNSTP